MDHGQRSHLGSCPGGDQTLGSVPLPRVPVSAGRCLAAGSPCCLTLVEFRWLLRGQWGLRPLEKPRGRVLPAHCTCRWGELGKVDDQVGSA